MTEEQLGALTRILEEVKEKRRTKCIIGDCIVNEKIGGNDIELVQELLMELLEN